MSSGRGAKAAGQKPAEAASEPAKAMEAAAAAPADDAAEAERERVLGVIAKLEALRDRLRSDPAPASRANGLSEDEADGRDGGRAAS